jgi:hypothetical protein
MGQPRRMSRVAYDTGRLLRRKAAPGRYWNVLPETSAAVGVVTCH